jgi:hypothetical protein
VTLLKDTHHIVQPEVFCGKQYQEMIHEVGSLAEELVAIVIFGFDN